MFSVTIPVFIRQLENLSRILSKAETWASERNIAPETILNYRLAPDMLPLARQVQIVSDTSKEQPHASPGRTSRATKTTKRHLPSFSSDSTRPVASRSVRAEGFRGGREPNGRAEDRRRHGDLRRHDVSCQFRASQFLFPLHHRLRHPAACRARNRQARFSGPCLRSDGIDHPARETGQICTLCGGTACSMHGSVRCSMSNSLLYITTVATRGSSWTAITYQLGTVAPEASIVYRFLLSSIILIGWVRAARSQPALLAQGASVHGASGRAPVLDQLHHLLFRNDVSDERACRGGILDHRHHEHHLRRPAARRADPPSRVALAALFGLGGLVLAFWSDITDFNLGRGGSPGSVCR